MHQYSLYGQCIRSEVRLLNLPDGKGPPTISVRKTPLPRSAAALPDECRELLTSPDGTATVYRNDEEIYWIFDKIGSVRITDGDTIEVDQADQAADGARQLILGPGFRTLLVQRGQLVFHASAVGIGGKAVLFIGESGAGKSTTAAALAAAGYPVLADDVTPLWTTTNGHIVKPGSSAVRIRNQDVKSLASGAQWLHREETGSDRQYVTPPVEPQKDQYPACRAYFLEWGEDLAIDTPAPSETVSTVLRASHPLYSKTNIPAFVDHFQRALTFADSVGIRRISRPKSTAHLARIVSMVETDVEGEDAME